MAMQKHLVSLNDLPPDGKEFELDDQDIWLEPLKEFHMNCRIIKPVHGKVFVQNADDGVLIRGNLSGEIAVPCTRCAEDAIVNIDTQFDEYEEIPADNRKQKDDGHSGYITFERNAPMLNLAEVGWEQFMLAQPVQPLCKDDCKGLCPKCGTNWNESTCNCGQDATDPRMAALAGVKINKSK